MPREAIFKSVLFLLVTALAPAVHGAGQGQSYIYDAKEAGDNRALLIDAITRHVEIQDKRSVHPRPPSGDLGSSYDDCGNEAFFCLTGLLEIVIPKSMPTKQWQYHDLSCESAAQSGSDVFRITCRSPKYRGTPTYTYSLSRGIISIDSSPIGGARGGFELRGQLGLYSPGNSP